jgi:hypothetical protein
MCLLGRSWTTILAVALVACAAGASPPAEAPRAGELAEALHELEVARLRLRLYERVDYPLRLQELEADIRLAEAEVASFRRRMAEYDRFDDTRALFATRENTRLQLLSMELRLKNLKQERVLLQIHNRDERRLRQLLVEQGERRVAALKTNAD